jgi:hypothetical protein
LLAVVLVVV